MFSFQEECGSPRNVSLMGIATGKDVVYTGDILFLFVLLVVVFGFLLMFLYYSRRVDMQC